MPETQNVPTGRKFTPAKPKVRLVYQDLEFIRSIILGTDKDDEAAESLLLKKIDLIMSKMRRAYRGKDQSAA